MKPDKVLSASCRCGALVDVKWAGSLDDIKARIDEHYAGHVADVVEAEVETEERPRPRSRRKTEE